MIAKNVLVLALYATVLSTQNQCLASAETKHPTHETAEKNKSTVRLLKAGKADVNTGGFRQDSASTLTNGSMRWLIILGPDSESQSTEKVRASSGADFMRFSQTEVLPNVVWEIRAGKISEDADKVEASGGVSVSIDKQDSELTADCVVYDKKVRILRTIGNVRILRRDQLTTGQRFDFKIASDEYLVTEPNVSVGEPLLKLQTPIVNDSKKGRGSK